MNEWILFTNDKIEAQEEKWCDLTHIFWRAREIHSQVSTLLIQCPSQWVNCQRAHKMFQESQDHCCITRLDKLTTTHFLALDVTDCIISLFLTHMEHLSSCASVGNSSYVARVAFWDYIFRGVQEEESAVLRNESERQEGSWQSPCRRDGWGPNPAQCWAPPSPLLPPTWSGPSEEIAPASLGLIA